MDSAFQIHRSQRKKDGKRISEQQECPESESEVRWGGEKRRGDSRYLGGVESFLGLLKGEGFPFLIKGDGHCKRRAAR